MLGIKDLPTTQSKSHLFLNEGGNELPDSAAEFSALLSEVAGTFFRSLGADTELPELAVQAVQKPQPRKEEAPERRAAPIAPREAHPSADEIERSSEGRKEEPSEEVQSQERETSTEDSKEERSESEASTIEPETNPLLTGRQAAELLSPNGETLKTEASSEEMLVPDEAPAPVTTSAQNSSEILERVKAEIAAKPEKGAPEDKAPTPLTTQPQQGPSGQSQTKAFDAFPESPAAKAEAAASNQTNPAFLNTVSTSNSAPQQSATAFPGLSARAVNISGLTSTGAGVPERDQVVSQLALKQAIEGAGKAGAEKNQSIAPQSFTTPLFGKLDGEAKGEAAKQTLAKAAIRPVPEQALEKVEAALREAARAKDGSTISLRLDPPNLGGVKVDVTLKDGTLHARLVPESPQVGQFLRDRAAELASSLRKLGIEAEKITVSVGSDSGASFSGTSFQESSGGNREGTESRGFGLPQGNQAPLGTAEVRAQQEVMDHWVA